MVVLSILARWSVEEGVGAKVAMVTTSTTTKRGTRRGDRAITGGRCRALV